MFWSGCSKIAWYFILSGKLFDIYQSYNVPFYVMGTLELVGGALYLTVPIVQRRMKARKCKENSDENLEVTESVKLA